VQTALSAFVDELRTTGIGVSVGEDGIVLVDDQFAPLAPKIKAALKGISDKPVKFVINTHFHGDHTGWNAQFGADSTIIAPVPNISPTRGRNTPSLNATVISPASTRVSRDQARSAELLTIALEFAGVVLKPGGAMIAKVFMGGEFEQIKRSYQRAFEKVEVTHTKASRPGSSELYLVARGFRGSAR